MTFGMLSVVPTVNNAIIDIGIRTLTILIIFGGLVLTLNISEDISITLIKS